jgi:hypothetical protein
VIKFRDADLVEIYNFEFRFTQELNPERDSMGQIRQFLPQSNYSQSSTSKLNPHGKGPFCKFSISSRWVGHSGVYALFSDEKLLYIGECVDLYNRYYMGYGNISPRNCFQGGQPTNCKINTMVLHQYLNGKKVTLYFHETDDYKRIKSILLRKLNPPYNGKRYNAPSTRAPSSGGSSARQNRVANKTSPETDNESIWNSIVKHEGEPFRQKMGKVFTYTVIGNGIMPSTTHWVISKSQFTKAMELFPFTTVSALQHLQGPSYLFAILTDSRIVRK